MHQGEVQTDPALVRRLLADQFPEWAALPIERVKSAGTDNALYRLGADKVVRLPRIDWAIEQVGKENRWLPKLAPRLPLPIPVPLAMGSPAAGYPWQWSVYQWIAGENASLECLADPIRFARRLAEFVRALQRIDAGDGPRPGGHNAGRGVPLAERDAQTRAAIAELKATIDSDAAIAAWEAALTVPVWGGPPVWVHGDLQAGNLLCRDGELSAIIDFGLLGVGDPACDLQIAWNFFTPGMREAFRAALQPDDAAWERGKGWALSVGVIALPYYRETNPTLAAISRRAILAVLAEHG